MHKDTGLVVFVYTYVHTYIHSPAQYLYMLFCIGTFRRTYMHVDSNQKNDR